ncbi:hypothetical protein H072_5723 [Dactylellina haptotyla CBS 200.50]|uniref:Uncharacterized protein n=1 Tax=Dactylellina haptotyla (strain CBS 200.50) TaxID=1284197 RepID=S8BYL2_DACHA|nr:hypothetical protein H072_5723 [Dactylellina haptotyla CBS 200.50]
MSASIHPAILQARRQQQSAKQSKMSITQTFYLAHKARGKLSSEAAKSDHDLRLLVGHANLLDRLMLHLQTAEREQDAWFNAMVRGNSTEEDESNFMDPISEEEEEEEETIGSLAQDYPESESSDEETDDDSDWESGHFGATPRPNFDYSKTVIDVDEVEVDEDFEEEDDGFYALRRTSSHAPMSPPELIEDDDSDSESFPPSPPQPTLADPLFYEPKSKKSSSTSRYYDSESTILESTYYSSSSLIPAF